MIFTLAAVAFAHTPGGCPSPATLLPLAQQGSLSPAMTACLEAVDPASPAAPVARLVRLDAGLVAGRVDVALGDAVLADVGAGGIGPDDALWIAERAAPVDVAFAARAVDRALGFADQWGDPVTREDRLARVIAVLLVVDPPRAATITLPPPAKPPADELIACRDVGRLWTTALWGRGYATERDCVARVMLVAPAADQAAVTALAELLAVNYGDAAAVRAIVGASRAAAPPSE